MELIVAVDAQWGIGRNGELLFHISEDMKHFRSITTGKAVVMGRKTLESLPGGKPLPNRENYVLSTNRFLQISGATVCHTMEECLQAVAPYAGDAALVIGGQDIYRRFLDYCSIAHITRVDRTVAGADCFFPNLDVRPSWSLREESAVKRQDDLCYRFCTYQNASPRPNPYA